MRAIPVVVLGGVLLTAGCGHTFVMSDPRKDQTPEEMLARADLVVVGIIERQALEPRLRFRVGYPPGMEASDYWRVLRRRVRVENVLLGKDPGKIIDTYEVFWTDGASGDWNATRTGERALFLLREEAGYYRIVRDWWRSIFPVTTGPHKELPLNASRPFWERVALMNWRIESSDKRMRIGFPTFNHSDPGQTLGWWRKVKLLRGMLRHPSSAVRVVACRELLDFYGWAQDECWEALSPEERGHLRDGGYTCCIEQDVIKWRSRNAGRWAEQWESYPGREERRLLTAVNDRENRSQFCRLYQREYPGDADTGCPADRPPPATIVTDAGDVPLVGEWPR